MTRLYELEIALAQVPLPGMGQQPLPWLVDRLFRNLLIDVTGNTHRSEICIDKLFLAGRADRPPGAGRVPRLRNAAERPHEPCPAIAGPRVDCPLLEKPKAEGKLVRWGTALHDRFMLPHYVWAGFPGRARRPEAPTASIFVPNGSRPSLNSASPSAARSNTWAQSSNCARRWNPGMSWVRKARRAAPCATSIQFGRAPAGQARNRQSGALHRRLQRPRRALVAHGNQWRRDCRCPLQGLATVVGFAPDIAGQHAAYIRHL